MDTPWSVVGLNKVHLHQDFDCGNDALDRFLKQHASQYEKRKQARTYVATLPGDPKVYGYYTVCNSSVALELLPELIRKRLAKHPVPTLHLARLAVDKNVRERGVGKELLFDAFRLALTMSRKVGLFAIDAFAKDEKAKAFYSKFGFEPFIEDNLHVFITVATIEAMFGQP